MSENEGTKRKRPAKAGVRLRINCLKAYLSDLKLPRPMGSELIANPNYAYKRTKPFIPTPVEIFAKGNKRELEEVSF